MSTKIDAGGTTTGKRDKSPSDPNDKMDFDDVITATMWFAANVPRLLKDPPTISSKDEQNCLIAEMQNACGIKKVTKTCVAALCKFFGVKNKLELAKEANTVKAKLYDEWEKERRKQERQTAQQDLIKREMPAVTPAVTREEFDALQARLNQVLQMSGAPPTVPGEEASV